MGSNFSSFFPKKHNGEVLLEISLKILDWILKIKLSEHIFLRKMYGGNISTLGNVL
jgi:hypothetical protein